MTLADVIDRGPYPKTRGELVEFLCDMVDAVFGPSQANRLSEGDVVDALIRLCELVPLTDEQVAQVHAFTAEYVEE